jgi:hypothetical protein
MILRATATHANVRNWLKTGYANGAWNGGSSTGPVAIHSSLAASTPVNDGVGYGLGSQIDVASVGGFTLQPTNMLIRHTLDGDADLDRDVDLDDVGRWSVNFTGELGGSGTKSWTQGDWDFDDDADLDDVGKWGINFTGELGGGGAGLQVHAPVPSRLMAAADSRALRSLESSRSPFATNRILKSVIF